MHCLTKKEKDMINKVILVGNVGADPEVRYVSEGLPVARIKLATSETYTDKKGEKVTKTEWHNIVVWRGLATVVEKYVTKGVPLYVEGKLTYNKYEKDGETKFFTEIVASEIKLLGRKDGANSNEPKVSTSAPSTEVPPIDLSQEPTDDLPF
jgi:single-strand DNA-binding protein